MLPQNDELREMVATTVQGLEEILALELLQLGAQNIEPTNRAVKFHGDLGFIYKANRSLRTALRILVPIHKFQATREGGLYQGVKSLPWSDWIGLDQTFAVHAVLVNAPITHSHFAALKVKDAIADRISEDKGSRPDVDTRSPDWSIHVLWSGDRVQISLDSSGDSLHRRGYKVNFGKAPVSEVLAAGMLLMTHWDGKGDLIDPFCGSGTILTEAAMIAKNIPANIHRSKFAYQSWPGFDKDLQDKIWDGLMNRIREFDYKIYGSDRNERVIREAQENIESALLDDYIELSSCDFRDVKKPSPFGFVVTNPPYDVRMAVSLEPLYGNIGTWLKHEFSGWNAYILAPDEEEATYKYVGLRPSRKVRVMNGPLDCRILEYKLFSGKKKDQ